MALGTAVVVAALISAWALPQAHSAANQRVIARSSLSPTDGSRLPTFQIEEIADSVGLRPLTRVLLAAPDGRRPQPSWTPPGCPTWPTAGQTCVSPALDRLLHERPALVARLKPGGNPAVIRAAGLQQPGELLIYQGVPAGQFAGAPAVGWGPLDGSGGDGISGTTVLIEMLALVGLPGLLFLTVSSRLSSATRLRRMRALRLLGLSRRQQVFIAAFEGRLAGLVGGLLGALAWNAVQSRIGRSGLAGIRWFAGDARLPIWAVAAIPVVSGLVVGRFCRAGAVRAADAPTQRVNHRAASLWRVLPFWLGIMTLAGYLIIHAVKPVIGGAAVIWLSGGGLAVIGLTVALRPLVELAAGALAAETDRSLSLRLGARRLQADSAGALRVLLGLVLVVLTGCIATGILRDVHLSTGPQSSSAVLTVDGSVMTVESDRDAVIGLPATAVFGQFQAEPSVSRSHIGQSYDPLTSGVGISYLTCEQLKIVQPTKSPCRDGQIYRVMDPVNDSGPLPVGQTVRVPAAHGTTTIAIPSATVTFVEFSNAAIGLDSLLVTSPRPVAGWPAETTFTALTPATDSAVSAFQDGLARIDPTAHADLSGADPTALAVYELHSGAIRFGAGCGFVLALIAFLVAVSDRARERRRGIAALRALGLPRATIRRAQLVELLVPAGVGLAGAFVIGCLIGFTYLDVSNLQRGWYWPLPGVGLALAGISLVAVASAGLLLSRRPPQPAELRRE
jgi:hypothetical protein